MNPQTAVDLLDRLHAAQNAYYAGGPGEENGVAAVTAGLATINGADHSCSTIGLYQLLEEEIAACWLLPLERRASDAIW